MKTFEIPAANLDALREKVEALNKRAVRLGLPPISLRVGEEFEKNVPQRNRTVPMRFFRVEVEGQPVRFEGWQFVAVAERLGDEVVLRTDTFGSPTTELPAEFRAVSRIDGCDHCHVNRYRKQTFVLRHDEGSYKVVGSTCIQDFVGSAHDATKLAAALEILRNLDVAISEAADSGFWDDEGQRGSSYYKLVEFLPLVALCIHKWGWTSGAKAYEHGTQSTADTAAAILLAPDGTLAQALRKAATDDDRILADRQAEAALAWARETYMNANLDALSDYERNLRALVRFDGFHISKHAGIAASIIAVYIRAEERKAEERKTANSRWFGTPGQRAVYTLTLLSVRTMEGMYGTLHIHRMMDADGNLATWFGSKRLWWQEEQPNGQGGTYLALRYWEMGDTLTVKATVKKHDTFRGSQVTLMNRLDRFVPPPPKSSRKARTPKPAIPSLPLSDPAALVPAQS